MTPTCFNSRYVWKILIKRAMRNAYYTSVHSQHNECLICANIQYVMYAYPNIHGRSATINTVVGTNSVCPLVGWLVGWFVGWGQIVFVSYRSSHGAVGTGEGAVQFMNIHSKEVGDMTWGGASGVQVGNNFLGKPKVFPSLVVYDGFSSSSRIPEFK